MCFEQYELFFSVYDSAGATAYELTFAGQLNGEEWNVDIFDFSSNEYEKNIGTLEGLTTADPGAVTITFNTDVPDNYIDSSIDTSNNIPEVLLRLRGKNGETGGLDFVAVAAIAGEPTPTPAPDM
ncbi:unnamed protein product, partial [Pylaiella littoralis]